ncbi:MAG: peptidase C11 [Lachnospiraceae bacterium]|nr:peptidase C11 [Lachnospiraceae bacterium]
MFSGLLGGGSGSGGSGSGGGMGSIFSGLLGGGDSMTDMLSGLSSAGSLPTTPATTPSSSQQTQQPAQASGSLLNSISSNVIGGWNDTSSIDSSTGLGNVNTNIALNTRAKYTSILGGGKDTVTILVYMCGTDLESGNGMATSDLMEMTKATLSDKVNLIVYTGGCKKWRNNILSNQTNQIYQVQNGGLKCLVSNVGAKEMTKPATLTEYIKWGVANFPANRTMLIFWDHGGGSISGYGYDEKFPRSGSMTLSGINQALKDAGTKFDIIGFDTCLMATVENALMLSQYGDYMVASEETEPGIGWYYTNWLTKLSANTSMPSLEIGKNIVDDFVSTCGRTCRGQLATLSVVDLAEVETTVPDALSQFSNSTVQLIKSDNYKTVSNARSHTREFATSSRIDQVDMVHLAQNINSKESKNLAKVLQSAIKYNLTSTNMTNAYGLSIYFPYNKVSSVNTIVNTYKQIGMDDDYTRCIQEFASLEVCGQASTGGFSTALPSLLGSFGGGSSDGSISSADMISQLLGGLLSSGNYGRVAGLDSTNTEFLQGRSLTDYSEYISLNQLDASKLVWKQNDDGKWVISLEDDQWELVQNLELNVFFDDGEGFIDLGLDTVYEFDKKGSLLGEFDNTWIAINEQPIAYYFLEQTIDGDNFSIMGRVPAFLNEQRVDLILIFDNEHPYGFVAGARINYDEDETETEAKGLIDIVPGDKIDFICDYYSYDGEFLDSYYLGEQMEVEADADGNAVLEISNVDIGDGEIQATYRFTDIYNQHYWTQPIK